MGDFRRLRKSRKMIAEAPSAREALGYAEWLRLEYGQYDFWVQNSIGNLLTWADYYAEGLAEVWTAKKGD